MNANNLKVMYYKGSEPNQGWHEADSIAGFLTNAEPIILGGYFGVVVNHAGVVAISELSS
jgi:hypothetical protein